MLKKSTDNREIDSHSSRFFWRKNPGPITPRPLRFTTIRGPHRCIRFADFSPPRGGVPACFRRLSTGTQSAGNDHCRGVGEGNAPTRQFWCVRTRQTIIKYWVFEKTFPTATQKQTLWGYSTRFNKSNKKYGWPCGNCCSLHFPNWRPLCKHVHTRAVRQLLSSLYPERRRIIVSPTWCLVPEGQPRWRWHLFPKCSDRERKIGKKFKFWKFRDFFSSWKSIHCMEAISRFFHWKIFSLEAYFHFQEANNS